MFFIIISRLFGLFFNCKIAFDCSRESNINHLKSNIMRNDNKVIVNLPKSHRLRAKFESKFPNAKFYGATSLGSGRASFLLPIEDYEQNLLWLKENKITKARSDFN
jgi:hypothetical protein